MARGGHPAIGNRLAPTRFLAFLAVLAVGYCFNPASGWRDAAAMAFDGAAAAFLISLVPLFWGSSVADMRARAARNDAGRALVLALTALLTLVVMAAITGELRGAQGGDPLAIGKLVGTLLLIWLFANSVYTLHYAHAYYLQTEGADAGGLQFPGTRTPDYWDFAYFAFTLGMTFQTSDVEIHSRSLRAVALLHSFAAFVFNIGVIAFTINLLAGSS